MKFSTPSVLFLAVAFAFLSCDKKPENVITIDFESPTANSVVADASNVSIHVHITATEEMDDVEILLHPDNDVSDLIVEVDEHVHGDSEYIFEEDLDLSGYPSGTMFHLEVVVCADHDCEEKTTGDIEFSIP
ncbi:MAG: hypothetical protein NWR72_19910 [Bacteroidia bacterium]|nr:hypothetical protein [Bacteroidia bacterium]